MNIATNSTQSFKKFPIMQVDSKLIRGKATCNPYRLYQLKQLGVNQIIDLRNTSFIKIPLEKLFCKLLGIKYINNKYSYSSNIFPSDSFFSQINQKIIENNGKTYIHCQKGKRRTGICVAAYEKEYINKSKSKILYELYHLGFKELLYPNSSEHFGVKKYNKLNKMLNDFLARYFPEELAKNIQKQNPFM